MQVLQARPSSQTLREQALQEGLAQMSQGLSGVDSSIKKAQETKRQQALAIGQARLDLEKMKYDTSKHKQSER
jgi:hypothetical protein